MSDGLSLPSARTSTSRLSWRPGASDEVRAWLEAHRLKDGGIDRYSSSYRVSLDPTNGQMNVLPKGQLRSSEIGGGESSMASEAGYGYAVRDYVDAHDAEVRESRISSHRRHLPIRQDGNSTHVNSTARGSQSVSEGTNPVPSILTRTKSDPATLPTDTQELKAAYIKLEAELIAALQEIDLLRANQSNSGQPDRAAAANNRRANGFATATTSMGKMLSQVERENLVLQNEVRARGKEVEALRNRLREVHQEWHEDVRKLRSDMQGALKQFLRDKPKETLPEHLRKFDLDTEDGVMGLIEALKQDWRWPNVVEGEVHGITDEASRKVLKMTSKKIADLEEEVTKLRTVNAQQFSSLEEMKREHFTMQESSDRAKRELAQLQLRIRGCLENEQAALTQMRESEQANAETRRRLTDAESEVARLANELSFSTKLADSHLETLRNSESKFTEASRSEVAMKSRLRSAEEACEAAKLRAQTAEANFAKIEADMREAITSVVLSERLQREVDSLTQQLESERKRGDDAEKKAAKIDQELYDSKEGFRALMSEKQSLQHRFEQASSANATVKEQLSSLSKTIEGTELRAMAAENEAGELKDSLHSCRTELHSCQSELQSLRAENTSLKQSLASATNERDAKALEAATSKQSQEQFATDAAGLMDKLHHSELQVVELSGQVEGLSAFKRRHEHETELLENSVKDRDSRLKSLSEQCSLLESELSRTTHELSSQAENFKVVEEDCRDLRVKLTAEKGKNAELDGSLVSSQLALDSSKRKLADTEEQLAESRLRVQNLDSQLQQAIQELQELSENNRETSSSYSSLKSKALDLERSLESARKSNEALRRDKDAACEKAEGLEVQLSALRRTSERSELDLRSVSQSLDEWKARANSLAEELESLRSDHDELARNLRERSSQADHGQSQLREAESKAAKLASNIQQLEQQLEEAEKAKASLEKQFESAKQDFEKSKSELNGQIKKLEEEIERISKGSEVSKENFGQKEADYKDQIMGLEREIEEQSASLRLKEEELEKLNSKLEQLKQGGDKQEAAYENTILTLNETVEQLSKRLENKQAELDEESQKSSKLAENLEQMQVEIENLQAQLRGVSETLASDQQDASAKSQEIANLKEQLEKAQQELSEARNLHTKLLSHSADSKSELQQQFDTMAEEAAKEADGLRAQLEEAQAKLADLQQQLDSSGVEHAAVVEKLNAEIARLKAELDALSAAVDSEDYALTKSGLSKAEMRWRRVVKKIIVKGASSKLTDAVELWADSLDIEAGDMSVEEQVKKGQETQQMLVQKLVDVGKNEIREMKSYSKPPDHVRQTWLVVMQLLGLMPITAKASTSWIDIRKHINLSASTGIFHMLQFFNPTDSRVQDGRFDAAKKNAAGLSAATVSNASRVALLLFDWINLVQKLHQVSQGAKQ